MEGTTEQEHQGRNASIDVLRAVAVLFMVLVHAAATWMPDNTSRTSPLAYLVAGIGGLAAPLFVVLFGWGIAASKSLNAKKIIYRAGLLAVCQILVNISAPHLFDMWTPGVLTLFSLLYLTSPWWTQVAHYPRAEKLAIASMILLPFVMYDHMGPSSWNARIETTSLSLFVKHLLLTGQYPILPWILFALLGAHLYHHPTSPSYKMLVGGGLLCCVATLVYSIVSTRPWALATDPTGKAILTFFPASSTFLLAASTGTLILWMTIYERMKIRQMVPLGRMSLTVYVGHFIPIGLFYDWGDASNPIHYGLILVYTFVWIPVAYWWQRYAQIWTLETIMRKRLSS
jgi:surface polysaccharide O-acyltransferase-like enzyme